MEKEKICKKCGKTFIVEVSHSGRQKEYCSPECKGISILPRNKACIVCGKEFNFEITGSGRLPKICSTECKKAQQRKYQQKRRKEYEDYLKWKKNRRLDAIPSA